MKNLLLSLLTTAILSQSACTLTAHMRSYQATKTPFDRNAVIYVSTAATMTVEEANFMDILKDELERAGLKISADLHKAEYVLSFSLDEPILLDQTMSYEPLMPLYQSQEWPVYYYPVKRVYGYAGLEMNISVYLKNNFIKEPHVPLWEAHLLTKKDTYREKCAELIRIILHHIGQGFEGQVKVP